MSTFAHFLKVHDTPSHCRAVDQKTISNYEKKLPEPIISFWQGQGFCAYDDGLIWVVNPKEFEDLLEDWIENPSESTAIVRTAFGDLFLWNEGEIHYLNVQTGRITTVMSDIAKFFDSFLCDKKILEKVFRQGVFQEALPRIGPPDRDECYAFVPALALGGSGKAETIERVDLRTHLSMLEQLSSD